MKVDYDPEANSLFFFLEPSAEVAEDDTADVAGGICLVGTRRGRPVWIQLLGADENIAALDEAAEGFGLDAGRLRAAARAALAAPNRELLIEGAEEARAA